jgi:hypothetical protein
MIDVGLIGGRVKIGVIIEDRILGHADFADAVDPCWWQSPDLRLGRNVKIVILRLLVRGRLCLPNAHLSSL